MFVMPNQFIIVFFSEVNEILITLSGMEKTKYMDCSGHLSVFDIVYDSRH